MNAIRTLCLLLFVLAPSALLAQESFQPYVAKVTGDSVRLRSGASMAHPPVAVMNEGDELTVISEREGWVTVRLPAAAPCWISADFVKASGDGNGYTVTGNKVNLRVSPDTSYFPVGQAEKDQALTAALDDDGKPVTENGYVKVIPPHNAHGAIASEFIEKVRNLAPEKTGPVKPQPAKEGESIIPKADSEPEAVKETAKETVKKEATRKPTKEELEDERKTFKELEAMLDDEIRKPAAEVNLTEIRKMFEQFTEFALDETISEKAALYIEKIDLTVKLIEAEKARLDKEAAKLKADAGRIAKEATERPKEVEAPKGPVEYLVIGTVGSHGKTAKTPASHRLFDADGNVLYDLRWDKGDLSKLMGSHVGIVGKVRSYDGWPHKVVIIERIDVVEAEESK
jgi:uncharacterized protein YgiM (DUF1202 family)